MPLGITKAETAALYTSVKAPLFPRGNWNNTSGSCTLGKMNPITFSIYPGRNSSYKLYLDDDGVSNKAETSGEYRLTQITHEG